MKKHVQFVVTGFGPFTGCANNPTPEIIEALLVQLCLHHHHPQQQPSRSEGDDTLNKTDNNSTFSIVNTHVFQTAAETVSHQLHDLYQSLLNDVKDDGVYIMLHLGVDIGSSHFVLEQCAYNDATFRVPDELGYQPTNIKVEERDEFAMVRQTTLPLDQITLSRPLLSTNCQISSDPGRYVCNYTYFKSLTYCAHLDSTTSINTHNDSSNILDDDDPKNNKRIVHALFLHVPPLEAIPLEEQVNFILHLMEVISTYVHQ